MAPEQVRAVLDRMLSGQANMLATNDVFWLCGCLLIALIPVIWLARPRFGRQSAAADQHPASAVASPTPAACRAR